MKFIKVIFVVLIIAIIGGIFGKIYLKNKNQNIKVNSENVNNLQINLSQEEMNQGIKINRYRLQI